MRKYTLTFGQNNHDDGYTTVTVEFDHVKSIDLDMSEMNLVAVLVDSTTAQFRVYLQVRAPQPKPLLDARNH